MWSIAGKLVSEGIGFFRDKQKARAGLKLAVENNRARLAEGSESHNHTWEMAALQGEGWELRLIRLLAYFEIAVPEIVSVVSPQTGAAIWEALQIVPDWIIGLHVSIYGWAFASTPIKNAAAGLVGSSIKFPKREREETKEE